MRMMQKLKPSDIFFAFKASRIRRVAYKYRLNAPKLFAAAGRLQLLLIIALAALMRFGRADIVEYFHDDAMLATLALETAGGGPLPLTGILSSTGIPNSPVSVYLLALPFAIKADPVFAIAFVMLLNLIGVCLLWLLARLCAGARVAFLAGLLYAMNPWAALYSRKLWAQDMHTPLILLGLLLLIYGFWRTANPPRRLTVLAQVMAMPLLIVAMQFHFAAWSLLPAIALALWVGRRRLSASTVLPKLALAVTLSLLALLPYALGLAETLERDPSRVADAFGRSAAGGLAFDPAPISDMLRLAAGAGLQHWLAPDQAEQLASRYPPLSAANYALLPVALLGLLACFRHCRELAGFICLWAFAPMLLLLPGWTPSYGHYLIPSIPALALLTAYGVDALLRWQRAAPRFNARFNARFSLHYKPLFKSLIWTALAGILALQFMQWQAALDFVESRHINYPGFTTPLSKLQPLRERLRSADDVLVISQGMAWNLHHEVAVWQTLLWQDLGQDLRQNAACVRTLVPDGYAVFPARPFTAVVAPDAPLQPRDSLYAHEDTEELQVYATRAGDRGYYVYDWLAPPAWSGPDISSIEPVTFSNGVKLTGYGLHDGEALLEWLLPGKRVGMDFQYSAQIYDEGGARLGQWDKRFWQGRHWCAGDRLLTWGPLAIDAAADTLKVAMYTLGDGENSGQYINAHVLDDLGNPAGHTADIALDPQS